MSTKNLLEKLKLENSQNLTSIIEFAAGMGRITKKVFTKIFKHIDVVEPSEPLAKKIEEFKNSGKKNSEKIKHVYVTGGDTFEFERKYDIIFGEWFLENISDLDLIKFLIKARENLNPNGKLIFKENSIRHSPFSISGIGQKMRNSKAYLFLFELCGLRPVYIKLSDKYPINYTQLYEFVLERDDHI